MSAEKEKPHIDDSASLMNDALKEKRKTKTTTMTTKNYIETETKTACILCIKGKKMN